MTAIKVKRSKFGFQQQPVLIFCLLFSEQNLDLGNNLASYFEIKIILQLNQGLNTKIKILRQWKMDVKYINLNCLYSIFVKKRNSHGHFKNKILHLGIVVLVLSLCAHSKKVFFLLNCLNLPVC